MLFGGKAREWLKPMREVRRTLLDGPLLHRHRHGIGHRGVELRAVADGGEERLVLRLGKPGLHLVQTEEVFSEDLFQADALLFLLPVGGRGILGGGENIEPGHDAGHRADPLEGRSWNPLTNQSVRRPLAPQEQRRHNLHK